MHSTDDETILYEFIEKWQHYALCTVGLGDSTDNPLKEWLGVQFLSFWV